MMIYSYYVKENFNLLINLALGVLGIICSMIPLGFFIAEWTIKYAFYICGVLIFILYVQLDTYLIMSRFEERYKETDYFVGALNIYMDLINMFLIALVKMWSCNNNVSIELKNPQLDNNA